MMRVKECIWLILFLCFFFIVVIYISRRGDTKVQMGSKLSSSSESEISVADHIQELIHKYPVMVFSKSYCPYSRNAKNILLKYKLEKNYHVLELDQLSSKADQYQEELGKLTGARTVPRVFIAGKCIGGGDDTSALEARGELERLLKEAKAIVD